MNIVNWPTISWEKSNQRLKNQLKIINIGKTRKVMGLNHSSIVFFRSSKTVLGLKNEENLYDYNSF